MPGILALDLATNTGWALARPGLRHLSGAKRVAPAGSGLGCLFASFLPWLDDLLGVYQPAAIFYEAPLVRRGVKSNVNNAEISFGLAAYVQGVAYARGIYRVTPVNNQKIKAFWTGNGHALKPEMVAQARARGYEPKSDDEADALALLDYAICKEMPKSAGARAHFLGLGKPLLSGAVA